jgi:uncharacterized protein YukE
MPYVTVTVRQRVEYQPPEAQTISARVDRAAREASEIGLEARHALSMLDPTWEGRSRSGYFDEHASAPALIEQVAAEAEAIAKKIAGLTVWVWETEEHLVWQPDP